MGYIRHHAIIVTAGTEQDIVEAQQKAMFTSPDFHRLTSQVMPGVANSYYSFIVFPDGSKEGWEQSTQNDKARQFFTQWLTEQGGRFAWAEIQYGDEHDDNKIVQCSGRKAEQPLPEWGKILNISREDDAYIRGYSDAFKRHRETAKDILHAVAIVPPTEAAYACMCDDCWNKVETYRHQLEAVATILNKEREYVVGIYERANIKI